MSVTPPLTPSLADYSLGNYDTGAGILKKICWYIVNALVFHSWLCPCSRIKVVLLRIFGAKVGTGVVIKPRVNIKYPWQLKVGDHVWIGEGVWIDNLVKVVISSNVCISQGGVLLTGNHDYTDPAFGLILGEIYLEEGVWIGANAIVCPGVRCARNAVLTVGSVLRKDAEGNGIYAGNPAVLTRNRIIRS